MSAALGGPLIVDQGDDSRIEVGSVIWGAPARLGKSEFKGDVELGALDTFHQGDGVELPLSRFGAICSGFIVASVVYPDLADLPAGEVAHPREKPGPAFFVF